MKPKTLVFEEQLKRYTTKKEKEYKRYEVTLKHLGNKYGVTLDQIHRVVTGKSWRHLV